MTDLPVIREYSPDDIPVLSRIWQDSFDDTQLFINDFFRLLPEIGTCIVLELDGTVIGMTSIINRCFFCDQECACLYAVAIEKEFRGRGYGKLITQAGCSKAHEIGASIIWLQPASKPLFTFYLNAAGFKPVLFRTTHTVSAFPYSIPLKLSAPEYTSKRNLLLQSGNYLRISESVMNFYQILCEDYGGGLFSVGDGLCAGYPVGDTAFVFEVIKGNCMPNDSAVASIAHLWGCKTAKYYLPSTDKQGDAFLVSLPDNIPADTVWNITFE